MAPVISPGSVRSLPVAGAARPNAGTADAEFSYDCHRCRRCCRDKRIQVNPYEVARLARALGLSTGEFVDRYVDLETMALRLRPDGGCVFLDETGCSVHADRPLACRLYPLGRVVRGQEERWVVLPAAPGSEGTFGSDGSVADYVRAQGAIPFMQATDAYYEVIERFVERAAGEADGADGEATLGPETDGGAAASDAEPRETQGARWLLDSDEHLPRRADEVLDVDTHVAFLLDALLPDESPA